jgi:hypothetical protein
MSVERGLIVGDVDRKRDQNIGGDRQELEEKFSRCVPAENGASTRSVQCDEARRMCRSLSERYCRGGSSHPLAPLSHPLAPLIAE